MVSSKQPEIMKQMNYPKLNHIGHSCAISALFNVCHCGILKPCILVFVMKSSLAISLKQVLFNEGLVAL